MDNNTFNITQYINASSGFELNTDEGNKYMVYVTGGEIGSSLPYHVTIYNLDENIMDFHMDNKRSFKLDGEIITFIID